MQLDFQTVNFKADGKLLTFIEEKLSKLNKFEHRIISIKAYLKVENVDDKDNKIVEFLVHLKNSQLFQVNKSRTFEAATDIAIDGLKEQLKRNKEKQTA